MALDMQSIYILASGGSRAMEQLDTVTNNIANVNTDGFKKMLIKEMSQRLDENGGDANHLFVFPRFEATLIDESQGALRQSGNPLDLALEGEGFFVVQNGSEQLLTRNGHFLLNEEGIIVDANGNALLSSEGTPITLDPTKRFDITPAGEIYQDQELVATIDIQDFEEIEPVGSTYYRAKGAPKEPNAKVHQGFLESSNINIVQEMSSLIVAQRRFETYGNLIKSLDQLNQKTNEIGKA